MDRVPEVRILPPQPATRPIGDGVAGLRDSCASSAACQRNLVCRDGDLPTAARIWRPSLFWILAVAVRLTFARATPAGDRSTPAPARRGRRRRRDWPEDEVRNFCRPSSRRRRCGWRAQARSRRRRCRRPPSSNRVSRASPSTLIADVATAVVSKAGRGHNRSKRIPGGDERAAAPPAVRPPRLPEPDPGIWDSDDCGRNCRRSRCGRSQRSGGHARRAQRCGRLRSRPSPGAGRDRGARCASRRETEARFPCVRAEYSPAAPFEAEAGPYPFLSRPKPTGVNH